MATTAQPQQLAEALRFPAGFVWGTATAAYQIEGATHEDGRSESIWDRFSATPGKVLNGDTGTIACDHYHRWRDDIALMKQMGLPAYRFSVSWPRILPDGTGRINSKGLDFYDRLVDGLLQAGITPYTTLYHWDLPQVLEDRGGWTNRATAYAFADFTEAVVRRLGDRVKGWITLNEPWCAAFLGYRSGEHAPGLHDPALALKATHHLLLAHGLALPVLRQYAPKAEIGITLNVTSIEPARPGNFADLEAVRRADAETNRLFLDPLFLGRYPQDYLDKQPQGALPVQPGDLELINGPFDFLGINFYSRQVVEAAPDNPQGWRMIQPDGIYTTMGWEVKAEGLYNLLTRLHQDYQPSQIYITENGASGEELPNADGQIHDPLRGYYLQEHLHQIHRAIEAGVPVSGYFAWSLLDNFEWAWGYTRRFGLVYVDFATQQRLVKDSGHWFSRVVRQNALTDKPWII